MNKQKGKGLELLNYIDLTEQEVASLSLWWRKSHWGKGQWTYHSFMRLRLRPAQGRQHLAQNPARHSMGGGRTRSAESLTTALTTQVPPQPWSFPYTLPSLRIHTFQNCFPWTWPTVSLEFAREAMQKLLQRWYQSRASQKLPDPTDLDVH